MTYFFFGFGYVTRVYPNDILLEDIDRVQSLVYNIGIWKQKYTNRKEV